MPLFPPATLYTALIIRLRKLTLSCIRALRRVRPAFLALLANYDPARAGAEQFHPLLDYVELRFAAGFNLREYWAWLLAPALFLFGAQWWAEVLRAVWGVVGMLWVVVGWWVMGGGWARE
ncbi:hypothetical protein P171DRAFT_442714 [Karstenula rhodostoma CBS 690.94]|uniref:Uncharacterized protein n=1 Tax=Karstenula rhodostoma CBS 690.94 TaxID=1392251 RepID=A0A9P4UC42_9PLEO|nr:hypothetical protein P171DRAFT_442714 [Karstenula rhodostoma CBS 690.94]